MNLRARHGQFKVWSGVYADIDRIRALWTDCLERYGGPYLFGETPTLADAMYAPVCTRFRTYGVELDPLLDDYCNAVLSMPSMQEWMQAALDEPDSIEELDMEF